jgi:acyl-CoA dehydrogenase
MTTAEVLVPTVLHHVASRAMQVHGASGTTSEMPFTSRIHAAGVMGPADRPAEVDQVTMAPRSSTPTGRVGACRTSGGRA